MIIAIGIIAVICLLSRGINNNITFSKKIRTSVDEVLKNQEKILKGVENTGEVVVLNVPSEVFESLALQSDAGVIDSVIRTFL